MFTRDGHISELGANSYLLGDLDGQDMARIRRHTHTCIACRDYVERVQAFDQQILASGICAPLVSWPQAPARPAGVTPIAAARQRRRSRSRVVATAGAALAMAAAVLLLVQTRGDQEGPTAGVVRAKASDMVVSLYAKSAAGTRRVYDGDPVHPGERIGFKIFTRRSGYLVIAGVDDRGDAYLCYPQDGDGHAVAVVEQRAGLALDQAIRLDDVLGREHILAILCPAPFSFADIEAELAGISLADSTRLPRLFPDCMQQEVVLPKVPPLTSE